MLISKLETDRGVHYETIERSFYYQVGDPPFAQEISGDLYL